MAEQPPAAYFRACRAWLDLPQTDAATLRAIERDQPVAADKFAIVHTFYADRGFICTGDARAALFLYDPPAA